MVESGNNDKPMIVVKNKDSLEKFSAEQISSKILAKLKD